MRLIWSFLCVYFSMGNFFLLPLLIGYENAFRTRTHTIKRKAKVASHAKLINMRCLCLLLLFCRFYNFGVHLTQVGQQQQYNGVERNKSRAKRRKKFNKLLQLANIWFCCSFSLYIYNCIYIHILFAFLFFRTPLDLYVCVYLCVGISISNFAIYLLTNLLLFAPIFGFFSEWSSFFTIKRNVNWILYGISVLMRPSYFSACFCVLCKVISIFEIITTK